MTPISLDYYTASPWLDTRDEIEKLGLSNHPEVKRSDEHLIKKALELGFGGTYESEEHPLEHWWWQKNSCQNT